MTPNNIRVKCILLLFLALCGVRAYGDPAAAFDLFKSFKGEWTLQSGDRTLPFKMTYDTGSKGSIVTEEFGKELSVFYRDGESLRMVHFCNAGNQPRLRLKESPRADRLEFEAYDVTNLKSAAAPHVQRIVYDVVATNKINLQIIWKEGNAEHFEKYALTKE